MEEYKVCLCTCRYIDGVLAQTSVISQIKTCEDCPDWQPVDECFGHCDVFGCQTDKKFFCAEVFE